MGEERRGRLEGMRKREGRGRRWERKERRREEERSQVGENAPSSVNSLIRHIHYNTQCDDLCLKAQLCLQNDLELIGCFELWIINFRLVYYYFTYYYIVLVTIHIYSK